MMSWIYMAYIFIIISIKERKEIEEIKLQEELDKKHLNMLYYK